MLSLRLRRERQGKLQKPWQTECPEPDTVDLSTPSEARQMADTGKELPVTCQLPTLPTNEQFSAYTIPGCQTDFPHSQRGRAGSYFFPLTRQEHTAGGVSSDQQAAAGAGPWAGRCLLPPADMGTKPTSASLPGFWSWSQTTQGAQQRAANGV